MVNYYVVMANTNARSREYAPTPDDSQAPKNPNLKHGSSDYETLLLFSLDTTRTGAERTSSIPSPYYLLVNGRGISCTIETIICESARDWCTLIVY